MKRLLRHFPIAFMATTVMMLITGAQVRMRMALGSNGDMDVAASLTWNAVIWYCWVLLIPILIDSNLRFPVDRRNGLVRHGLLQIALAVVLILAHAVIVAAVMQLNASWFGVPDSVPRAAVLLLTMQAHWGLMCCLCTTALVHVVIWSRRAQAEALARERLRTETAAAQLATLQRQMQPHFLFNSLNALVAMLDEDAPAQRFTLRLADMLRVLLQFSEKPTATLGEELALVEAYLAVEHARLGSRLRTAIDIDDALRDCLLPTFTLQPLVENAVRHSISRAHDGGEIALRARREGDEALIEVRNTSAHLAASGEAASGLRLTLPNCRRRLALLYGEAARFEADFVARDVFRAAIILPLGTSLPEFAA